MSVIQAIILGFIQGVTEFLPVSSFAHLCIVEKALGVGRTSGTLFECMLHLGTMIAVVLAFRKDLKKIGIEILGMLMDMLGNVNLFFYNRKTGKNLKYSKIVTTDTYRKFSALILVSMIPTAVIGYTAKRLVTRSVVSTIVPGIGLLITGIILLVIDTSKVKGEKTPNEAEYDSAMWIGIGQGFSVFPGISRSALTVCIALLCGFSKKFAIKFSYILSVPTILGAFFVQFRSFTTPSMTVGLGFTYVLAMLVAALSGYCTIRIMLKLFQQIRFRYFAIYCFIMGIYALSQVV